MNNYNGRTELLGETGSQDKIVRRNFEAVAQMQHKTDAARSRQERAADWITAFSGSMAFVYLHAIWFVGWILLNIGLLHIPHLTEFDPYPFGLLTLVVSLEAIFLSTFVLISQNRQARISERRTELDLQINLLAEQKGAKVIEMLDHVIEQLNAMNNSFYVPHDQEAATLKVSPHPEEVMQVIDDSEQEEAGQVSEQIEETKQHLTDKVDSVHHKVSEVDDQVEEVATSVREINQQKQQKRTD
ncbi:MAG: DUF1003 domain-containing protein [Blastocatellia bacterium]